jgi:hypothetical protein
MAKAQARKKMDKLQLRKIIENGMRNLRVFVLPPKKQKRKNLKKLKKKLLRVKIYAT